MLVAAYAATLPVHATEGSRYGGDEPLHLATAASIVEDGDVDLPGAAEPPGVGFPLLIAPAYALGGDVGVEVFLAALAALAFALAVPLARRVVPEPWATRAVLVTGLSPPALAYSANVYPELVAGGVMVAATLLALRVRDASRLRHAYASAALLGTLPWLGPKYVVPGALLALLLVRWTARRGRGVGALFAAEIVGASLVVYGSVNTALYGRLTPYDIDVGADHVSRVPRLVLLWLERDAGLLRWAPFVAMAFLGAFLLWRSLGDRIARALPERRDAEAAAAASLAICAGAIAVATFGAPDLSGPWFPGRHLIAALPAAAALCAWGLRRAPRAGAALAVLTLVASAWLAVALIDGGWIAPGTSAPLGPLLDVLPRAGTDWADALAVAVGASAAALVLHEWRRWARNRSADA